MNLVVEKGLSQGGYYEYRYDGYARGYWTATPTMVAHFSRGKYLLTDKESFERKSSSIGDVMVHAHDKSDFIIFSETLYIDKLSFLLKKMMSKITSRSFGGIWNHQMYSLIMRFLQCSFIARPMYILHFI